MSSAIATSGVVPAADEVSSLTTIGVFLRQAERFGDGAFLHHHDGGWRSISWTEARARVMCVAAGLVEAGVKAGDSVILLSENRWEWLCCDLGIQAAGAITVPVYPSTQPALVRHIANDSEAVLAITSSDAQSGKLHGSGSVRRIVLLDQEVAGWMASQPGQTSTIETGRRLRNLDGSAVASIVYTSGTTGDPKGVELPHQAFLAMADGAVEGYDLGPSDSELSYLPYAHVMERTSGVFTAIAAGLQLWISRGMDFLVEDIAQVRPTVMLGCRGSSRRWSSTSGNRSGASLRSSRRSSAGRSAPARAAFRVARAVHWRGPHCSSRSAWPWPPCATASPAVGFASSSAAERRCWKTSKSSSGASAFPFTRGGA